MIKKALHMRKIVPNTWFIALSKGQMINLYYRNAHGVQRRTPTRDEHIWTMHEYASETEIEFVIAIFPGHLRPDYQEALQTYGRITDAWHYLYVHLPHCVRNWKDMSTFIKIVSRAHIDRQAKMIEAIGIPFAVSIPRLLRPTPPKKRADLIRIDEHAAPIVLLTDSFETKPAIIDTGFTNSIPVGHPGP